MIPRDRHLSTVARLLSRNPVVALLGARQVGKTTLARQIAAAVPAATFFDLERGADVAQLADPELALGRLTGLVVIDEVQRRPDLFPALRVLADRPRRPARFLVLGSAAPSLLRQGAESLAGRIAFHELPGLSLDEVGAGALDRVWLRGGFPRAFTARSLAESAAWRREFVRTFLQRDVPQLGIGIPAPTLERFWAMLAHYHGQIWNASELARAFGVSHHAIGRYLDVLAATFMLRVLRPWFENLGKRQVKSPKVYIRDSGLLHTLLDVGSLRDLERHPKVGASWEGFVLETIVERLGARPEQCYFWATHTGAELDLLVVDGPRRFGFEIKRTTTPGITPSMRSACADLNLTKLVVVHAGTDSFPLSRAVGAVSAGRLLDDLAPLGSR
ncbi:MAG: ATP-binding protein [Vicinamibacterales bacterium]|nr:ATP-binding protein [Vicinamibacterales bacterium]